MNPDVEASAAMKALRARFDTHARGTPPASPVKAKRL